MKWLSELLSWFAALSPRTVALGLALVSAAALLAALTAQFGFHVRPCTLCLYQRIPFLLVAVGGTAAWFLLPERWGRVAVGISGIVLLINAAIAAYHSGVERKWWAGLGGCSAPDMNGSIEDLLKRIESTNVTRCDEIPWSLFGLSMANYNVLMCLGLAGLCGLYLLLTRQKPA